MAKQKEQYSKLYDALCAREQEKKVFTLESLAETIGYKVSTLKVYMRNKLRNKYIFEEYNGLYVVRGICKLTKAAFANYMCQKASTPFSVEADTKQIIHTDPFSQDSLDYIFLPVSDHSQELRIRENEWLEFKENYTYANRTDYAKTMAALANTKGGYIVFGVKNGANIACGMSNDHFTKNFDPRKLTQHLEQKFSQTINWSYCIHEVNDRRFGLIHVHECTHKPVVAIATTSEITDGDIFYRYSGESKKIKSHDLLRILKERLVAQDAGWRDMIQRMTALTPQNADVLDLATGRIGNTPILIDMKAMEQIRFIREGQFHEVEGAPTLKLIGEVEGPAGAITVPKEVPVSNCDRVTAGVVAQKVKAAIGKPFNASYHHVKCWKYYVVRPSSKDPHPENCKTQFCSYDKAHRDWVYTQEWIDFLIQEILVNNKYDQIIKDQDTIK